MTHDLITLAMVANGNFHHRSTVMKITLSIDSRESIEIGHMDLASIVNWLDDDVQHAFFYSRLAQHPASEVRSAIAGKASLPLDVLVELAGDASIEVVRQLANNQRALKLFELPLIQKIIIRDVSVADEIADNLYRVSKLVRVGVIQALLQHTDPKVAEKAENFVCDADEFDCDEE
jgi:hypothetical protein